MNNLRHGIADRLVVFNGIRPKLNISRVHDLSAVESEFEDDILDTEMSSLLLQTVVPAFQSKLGTTVLDTHQLYVTKKHHQSTYWAGTRFSADSARGADEHNEPGLLLTEVGEDSLRSLDNTEEVGLELGQVVVIAVSE